ncbi:MAG: hypothetical protein ACF8AM_15325 [Rhodopirellula sp. JB055]|uniref:hypothetical protein n=1 Tax=Rhodopirellula sp. JB055 TaxID=3342846 RepID=UPI00370C1F84
MTHRIRLRRPWTREIFRDGQSLHRADRVDVPDVAEGNEVLTPEVLRAERGNGDATPTEYHAIYQRHFNCPTGLEDDDQVSIEIAPAPSQSFVVRLNDEVIGSSDQDDREEGDRDVVQLPVPKPLVGQNQLEIELRSKVASSLPRCVAEVALRIDAAS